LPPANT